MERRIAIHDGQTEHHITVDDHGVVIVDGTPVPVIVGAGGELRIGEHGATRAWVAALADTRWIYLGGRVYELDVEMAGRRRRTSSGPSSLSAPMPATVIRVEVSPGEQVRRGDTLVILEAMKMELPIRSPRDATVVAVNCREGELVQPGVPLLELDES